MKNFRGNLEVLLIPVTLVAVCLYPTLSSVSNLNDLARLRN